MQKRIAERYANRKRKGIFSFGAALFILYSCYFLTGTFGLAINAVGGFATLVWPPTGISLAALLLGGYRLWPAVTIAAFHVNYLAGASSLTAMGIAVGNTAEALLGTYLIQRGAEFVGNLERVSDITKLIGFGAIVSTMVSATCGVTTLVLGGTLSLSMFPSAWRTWWIGDALGNLVIAPLILVWGTRPSVPSRAPILEIIVYGVSFVFIVFVMCGFVPTKFPIGAPMQYLVFPHLIWAAFRIGLRGLVTTTFVLSSIAVWATSLGVGPFSEMLVETNLLYLQLYMAVIAVTGLVLGATVAARDLAEKMAKEQGERLRTVVENAMSGIITFDATGNVKEANPAAESIFGYEKDELPGKNINLLFAPQIRHRVEKAIHRIRSIQDQISVPQPSEVEAFRKNGDTFFCLFSVGRMLIGSRPMFTAIVHDISHRKFVERELLQRTSELEQSNQELEQVAIVASHDLGAPLRTIERLLERADRYLRDGVSQRALECMKHAKNGISNLHKTTEELLRHARFGEKRDKFIKVEVEELLKEVVENLRQLITETNAFVQWEHLPVIFADRSRIYHVFQNLVANAIRYHRQGVPPRISISYGEDEKEWTFHIEDNGVGIDEKVGQRVFLPYERLAQTAGNPGTGIGLTFCKTTIDFHGGRIWYRSQPGKGTIFSFTICKQQEQNTRRSWRTLSSVP